MKFLTYIALIAVVAAEEDEVPRSGLAEKQRIEAQEAVEKLGTIDKAQDDTLREKAGFTKMDEAGQAAYQKEEKAR